MKLKINITKNILKVEFAEKFYSVDLTEDKDESIIQLYGQIIVNINEEIEIEVDESMENEIDVKIANTFKLKLESEIEDIKENISNFII